MPTKCFAQVRGSVIRATRLDACGKPITGAVGTSMVSVSKRISSVTIDEVTEDGTNIRERNMAGELCIVDDDYPDLVGYSTDIALCGVDPDMIRLFTGQPVVLNAAGETVGFDATDNVDLDGFGFSLEVWSRIAGNVCDASGRRQYGYTVFPFIKGGRLGGFSYENGPVSFNIQGARTQTGNQWGAGPFNVDVGVGPGFAPSPLFTPLGVNTHFRNILVGLAPPVATCGAAALAAA